MVCEEKKLHDILNAIFGLNQFLTGTLESSRSELIEKCKQITEEGARNNSPEIVQFRKMMDEMFILADEVKNKFTSLLS